MNNPKISVLMPVYNAEKYLREAIDSILNQTFIDFEFLIINDASTDNSKKIILSYKDPRIRYYENTNNLGVAKTLNKGLRLAKTNYIARMDADDISIDKRLEFQYNKFGEDKNIVIVASYYEEVDERGFILRTVKDAASPEKIFYTLQFRNCLGHPTVMFNKSIIFGKFNGYSEKNEAEDYDLWLRVSKYYKIIKIPQVLHKLRITKHSRIGLHGNNIDDNALCIAQKDLNGYLIKPLDREVVKILTVNNSTGFSPNYIRKALKILYRINKQIIFKVPRFLNKEKVAGISLSKERYLKINLILSCFRHSISKCFTYYYYSNNH